MQQLLASDALACPDDGAFPLTGEDTALSCPACGRSFPSEGGILRMLPSRPELTPEEREAVEAEQAQRDLESGAYDRLVALRLLSLLEIPALLGPLAIGPADRVLELGCGTGRLTLRWASRAAAGIAIDHSLESLRVLGANLGSSVGMAGEPPHDEEAERARHSALVRRGSAELARRGFRPKSRLITHPTAASCTAARPLLVQGDATRLPVQTGWATRALSAQVLEHVPSPRLRERFVAELARTLAPEGRLALSAYGYPPLLRPLLRREGRHSGRIFYHRFETAELARLLESLFSIERLSGRLGYVLLAHGRPRALGVER